MNKNARKLALSYLKQIASIVAFGAGGALVVAIVERIGEGGVTAYATAFLAAVTTALAFYTAALASDSRQASRLADKHHQESLSPFLTLASSSGKLHITYGLEGAMDKPSPDSPRSNLLTAVVELLNAGNGPALTAQFRVRFDSQDGTRWFPSDNPDDWAGVGTIESMGKKVFNASLIFGDDVHGMATTSDARAAFEMTVKYRNIFGAIGEVVVRSDDKGNYNSEERLPAPVIRALPNVGSD